MQVDSQAALTAKIESMRKAQRAFAAYTQEQVDEIFFAAAKAANRQRIPLAKMAVAETGMGVVEDKILKNHFAAEYVYNAYKDMKTCGVIEEDPAYGFKKIAEPVGLVAAVIPTTNPTSTAIFKALLALKTRNAIIFSPHPRAKECTIAAARLLLGAAVVSLSAPLLTATAPSTLPPRTFRLPPVPSMVTAGAVVPFTSFRVPIIIPS